MSGFNPQWLVERWRSTAFDEVRFSPRPRRSRQAIAHSPGKFWTMDRLAWERFSPTNLYQPLLEQRGLFQLQRIVQQVKEVKNSALHVGKNELDDNHNAGYTVKVRCRWRSSRN